MLCIVLQCDLVLVNASRKKFNKAIIAAMKVNVLLYILLGFLIVQYMYRKCPNVKGNFSLSQRK